ncbi:AAA domain-containing protein [Paenibacillus vini]|uniref:DEAD/DEAH box helicase n=1 Tax=Paenibacillus vini TaxID=1476024 RepID=UPI0025B6AA86|nr:AAA domain-containing protein [Paenibacillus vini]MDN4066658.1 AAA domain-containing protein [Paenibacillus vini]
MTNELMADFFTALIDDRTENANILEKPSMSGVKNSVVEKYSDQAHFIYELLQNADDAKATFARFELHEDHLIFAHNGTKRFSVSNPKTESEDAKEGRLGDINAITSIANSNKTAASIGKFGVGFKAVFQYTQTPHIYDPIIYFKIKRFIVPEIIDSNYPGRLPDETLFMFPFDHMGRTSEEAYEDISEKLTSLVYPSLFLTNLSNISFQFSGSSGGYVKTIEKEFEYGGLHAQRVSLERNFGGNSHTEELWLFSRKIDELDHMYSVGFSLNEEGKLVPLLHTAFCFFPTKETTGLNFIIHAPFLLTDSREGIKAGELHNRKMINLLAKLAADSLSVLRDIGKQEGMALLDDSLFEIIPYDESKFGEVTDRNRISFKPFYTAFQEAFKHQALLPGLDGFVLKKDAYWAEYSEIATIYSNQQLAKLTGNPNAQWVLISRGRAETLRNNKPLAGYLDNIIEEYLTHNEMLDQIDGDFIEKQEIDWLHRFYKYIHDSAERRGRVISRCIPVFLDQDGKAAYAFDEKNQAVLFLPVEDIEGYKTINSKLLENDETAKFTELIGITTPSLKDEIYNKILPQYKDKTGKINTIPHFKKIFQYYLDCPRSESDSFIEKIKSYGFVSYRSVSDATVYRGVACELYFPDPELLDYFKFKPTTNFVLLDVYKSLVGEANELFLVSFLSKLGVRSVPRIIERELSWQEAQEIKEKWSYTTQVPNWTDRVIDGCEEVIKNINEKNSVFLWNQLCEIMDEFPYDWERATKGIYRYFYYSHKEEYFDSSDATRLRTQPWLLNNHGELVRAAELTLKTLSPKYRTDRSEAWKLIRFLGIQEKVYGEGNDSLTDEQRSKIEFADSFADIPRDKLEEFAKQHRLKQKPKIEQGTPGTDEDSKLPRSASPGDGKYKGEEGERNEDRSDEDDYIKPSIDFNKKIEEARQRSETEIQQIAYLEELTQRAENSQQYSFGWFKALLELESHNGSEGRSNSREISISFAKVEQEAETTRTLILKLPNRHIPQSMEDLADIPLVLYYGDQSRTVAIEVVNVKSYTLRVKLKSNAEIDGIDLSLVSEARIDAKNPGFLLEELRKQFNELKLDDHYNMKENLCKNIEFVFGPPGTGKTTHLAREVLIPLMQRENDAKVLVLTPTNKAADVLVNRIMEIMGNDNEYDHWLVRFGATGDNAIAQSNVYRDKSFDIRALSRHVTVTTIARFPYDFFIPDSGIRLHLHALKWDYIVIDEASMIPLVNIILPLYKKTPEKFIIAGDPFQIEPISTVDLWKDENIYSMVELNSFKQPVTVPHPYPVKLLNTQYRSIPVIGEVFSHFAYDGVLQHHRTADSRRKLNIDEHMDIKPLNIIKFPVSKFESIYRSKRLQGKSSYHIYSALFSFEFIKYLSMRIDSANENEFFRIGIIAPYRAQSDLIDKLLSSWSAPKSIDIQVGTIHGFQGDECDIIISVFNPPPTISSSNMMFLNKRNIINVSVSRARDYLFILMPDDDTEQVEQLKLVKKIETLCKATNESIEIHSSSIEDIIFHNEHYLEDNSFTTSHQLVNVYVKPEKRYEVRSEDLAVDIQINPVP